MGRHLELQGGGAAVTLPSPRDSWDGISRQPFRFRRAGAVGIGSEMSEYD